MRLILVRHAQSANNALPDHQRVHDPGLTTTGILQAEQLGAWCKTLPITALWCSPFKRSLDTTEAIRQRGTLQKPFIHLELHELGGCYSGYEAIGRRGEAGMGRGELSQLYPQYEVDPRISDQGWWQKRPYETDMEAELRATRVIGWFQSQLQGQEDLAVAVIHADFKRILLKQMLRSRVDVDHLGPIFNASVTALRWEAPLWKMDFYNAISHLPYELHTD